MLFLDALDAVWVVERFEELKEAQFRCTMSGSYARFQLTPAQDDTYVELEIGMDPTSWRWKVAEPFFGLQYKAGCSPCSTRSPQQFIRATPPRDIPLLAGNRSRITAWP